MSGTVSALVVQKKNKNRVNVYLDGKFAFGLAAIEAIKLRRGQVLTDEDIAQLKSRDDVEKAYERALKFLEYRPRSIEETRRYLDGKDYPPEIIEQIIERLSNAGLLDDRAFVQFWLENRATFRPRSARALRHELRQKGISNELIAEMLEEEHDENNAAYAAAISKARRWRGLDAASFRQKLGGFLARRGFSYEVVRETTARVWQELDEPDSPDILDKHERLEVE